jgi:hypothetical protein
MTTAGPVTLEVFTPTGAIEVTQFHAPRLPDLRGKTICEVSNNSWEAQRTFPLIRKLLKERFLDCKIIPFTEFVAGNRELEGASTIGDEVVKKGGQAAILGNSA